MSPCPSDTCLAAWSPLRSGLCRLCPDSGDLGRARRFLPAPSSSRQAHRQLKEGTQLQHCRWLLCDLLQTAGVRFTRRPVKTGSLVSWESRPTPGRSEAHTLVTPRRVHRAGGQEQDGNPRGSSVAESSGSPDEVRERASEWWLGWRKQVEPFSRGSHSHSRMGVILRQGDYLCSCLNRCQNNNSIGRDVI